MNVPQGGKWLIDSGNYADSDLWELLERKTCKNTDKSTKSGAGKNILYRNKQSTNFVYTTEEQLGKHSQQFYAGV